MGRRVLVIGCHGGVGRAVLSLLEFSEPGRQLRARMEAVFLADRGEPVVPVPLSDATLLPPTAILSATDLTRLVRAHGITQVVDGNLGVHAIIKKALFPPLDEH